MSELTQAMLINALILAAALHNDLGAHRKIGLLRILLPLSIAAGVIPLFLSTPVTHGTGLAVEIAGAIGGILFGLAATALMPV
jgi:membrane associated rhomboid family serine protease